MTVTNFDKARFQRFAKEFVPIYVDQGPEAAGRFALEQLPRKEDRVAAKSFVKQAFEDAGYIFSVVPEEV